jgi:hypothetical protein
MIEFAAEVQGLTELTLRLEQAEQQRSVPTTMRRVVELVKIQAQANIRKLFKNPEKMEQTVSASVEDHGPAVVGTVTASGLPYLRIHELGGTIQTPEIFPRNAKALHWLATGSPLKAIGGSGEVFAMHTRAHPTKIPERSYMRLALRQKLREIEEMFGAGAKQDLAD